MNADILIQDTQFPEIAAKRVRKHSDMERLFGAVLRRFQAHLPERKSKADQKQRGGYDCE